MGKYLVEFIGTFFLVFVAGMSGGNALIIGVTLVALVYMGFHTSGAHYNPAVTLAVWMRKRISGPEAWFYVGVQLAGALAAAILFYTLFGKSFCPKPSGQIHLAKVALLEGVFTFLLVFVILNVATHRKAKGNQYYGLAIGFTVFGGVYAIGPLTGGALNPALATGTTITRHLLDMEYHNYQNMGDLWIYLAGPFAGGALAGLLFNWLHPGDVGE